MPFESFCPVVQVMNLIQQKDRRSASSTCFGVRKTAFPETGKRRIRLVTRRVDGGIADLSGELEQQRRLADLARSGEELDSAWGRLAESFQEPLPAPCVVAHDFIHSRIIIRLYPTNVNSRTATVALAGRWRRWPQSFPRKRESRP